MKSSKLLLVNYPDMRWGLNFYLRWADIPFEEEPTLIITYEQFLQTYLADAAKQFTFWKSDNYLVYKKKPKTPPQIIGIFIWSYQVSHVSVHVWKGKGTHVDKLIVKLKQWGNSKYISLMKLPAVYFFCLVHCFSSCHRRSTCIKWKGELKKHFISVSF